MVLPLDDKSLGGVAPPTIVVFQILHQIARLGPAQLRLRRDRSPVLRADAPNATVFFAGAPWSRILEFVRDPLRVFDVFAIEIDHVKAAVRTGRGEHRMKPGIGRSEKLLTRLSAFCDERSTLGDELAPLDEVVHRFADEKVAAIVGRECVAAINRRATGGREVIGSLWDQQRGGSEIIDPALVIRAGDRYDRLRPGQQRDAVEVALFEDDMADRDVVEDRKTIPPIIVRRSELRVARNSFELFRLGAESKIASAD